LEAKTHSVDIPGGKAEVDILDSAIDVWLNEVVRVRELVGSWGKFERFDATAGF